MINRVVIHLACGEGWAEEQLENRKKKSKL